MSTHFLHFKFLLNLLEGQNLLFRNKDSLLRENSLMVISHSLNFVQLLPMVKQENNITLYILQKSDLPQTNTAGLETRTYTSHVQDLPRLSEKPVTKNGTGVADSPSYVTSLHGVEWSEVKWSEVAQSCLTLCDPMDCSPPASSVHGIFQARILEWVAISFSRGSSRPRGQTWVSCIAGRCFTIWATREVSSCNSINYIWHFRSFLYVLLSFLKGELQIDWSVCSQGLGCNKEVHHKWVQQEEECDRSAKGRPGQGYGGLCMILLGSTILNIETVHLCVLWKTKHFRHWDI